MQLAETLRSVPLFELLGDDATTDLARAGSVENVPADCRVCTEGESGSSMYVVLEGSLQVSKSDGQGGEIVIARLGPGEFFGEMSLLGGDERSASVTSESPCRLYRVDRSSLLELIVAADSVDLAFAIASMMAQRIRTVSERVIADELEQRVLTAELEADRHRSLAQMVAGVAHELNTPLGVANTAVGMIASRVASGALPDAIDPDDRRAQRALDDIVEASDLAQRNMARANRLIESFKKISVDQVATEQRTVDLGEVVSDVVEVLGITARQAGLVVSVDDQLTADCRMWTGDPGLMVQVLTNLLVNAERHAYPGGGGGPVRIVLTSSSTTRTITVSDDGVGITPDALGQVFAPFFTTARGAGGSGLGLAIVRNLVNDAMRGEITADSDEGNGTTFVVTVPAGEHPQDLPATS